MKRGYSRIVFALPHFSSRPVGGYKIVYEHANRLAEKGFPVTLVHEIATGRSRSIIESLRQKIRYAVHRTISRSGPKWFPFHENVSFHIVPRLSPATIPDGDIYLATSWETADAVWQIPAATSQKYYFVQDYEKYRLADAQMRDQMKETFQLGMTCISTSPAVTEMLLECGVKAVYVPCAIDFSVYRMVVPIDSQDRQWVGFPLRPESHKRTEDAILALQQLREKMGQQLQVWTYGSSSRHKVPDWVTVLRQPTDHELCDWFNRTKVFVLPSEQEGWGLPGSEAQACGAALSAVDNPGVHAYAIPEKTALLSNPRDADGLANNIQRLLTSPALRIKIAQDGLNNIRRFNWEDTSRALRMALQIEAL